MAHTAFDTLAPVYDQSFTETAVGKLQRQLVWDYLERSFKGNRLNILEINCGTGTDAAFLASKGHVVTATDASEIMIAKSKEKYHEIENLTFEVAAFNKLSELYKTEKYDLIFSNFGGLNCVSPEVLQYLLSEFKGMLNKNGRIISVVMGKFCLIESLYFLYKRKIGESLRRSRKEPVLANVDGEKVLTWYYAPATFFDMAGNDFKKIEIKPIGITIPPSYLNNYFEKNQKLLFISKKVDKFLAPLPFSVNLSDHYLIDLVLDAES